MELIHFPALAHLVSSLFPTVFAGCLPPPTSAADYSVARFLSRLWYYTAVRLLTEHHSPLRLRL